MRSVARDEADRVGGGAQVAGDERQVGGLDRHVGAGADRQAEVGLGERGRVVDAVADHRHDAALGLQAADRRRPCRRAAPRRSPRRCRPRRRRRGRSSRCRRSAGPGAARAPCSDATASAELSLTVSATTKHGGRLAVPAGGDGGLPARLGGAAGGVELGAAGASPSRPAAPGRPTIDAWPSTTPSTPRPSRLAKPSTAGSGPSAAARPRRSPGDRVLGGVLERADEAQRLVAVDAVGDGDARRGSSARW